MAKIIHFYENRFHNRGVILWRIREYLLVYNRIRYFYCVELLK